MTIIPPVRTKTDPLRFTDCQNALEKKLSALVVDAVSAGWSEAEVLASIQELTDKAAAARGQDVALSVKIRNFNMAKVGV